LPERRAQSYSTKGLRLRPKAHPEYNVGKINAQNAAVFALSRDLAPK
jgi:hypothetical protein